MLFTIKCPACGAGVKLPSNAATATCPQCLRSFPARESENEPAATVRAIPEATDSLSVSAQRGTDSATAVMAGGHFRPCVEPDPGDDDDSQGALPPWVNPWGFAACGAATLALLVATLTAVYWLTVALAVAGIGMACWGACTTSAERWPRERVSLFSSGGLNALILLLALFVPGVLNGWWSIDVAPPKRDRNALVVVPRDNPLDEGKPLESEWTNAETEAVRQDDVLIRLESVRVSRLPKKPGLYFLVHFRLSAVGSGETIRFEGYAAGGDGPRLTDDFGTSYAFVEQRKRKETPGPRGARGTLVFEEAPPEPVDVVPDRSLDLVLVFDGAPAQFVPVKLELPASAWGREGLCRFRINGPLEARRLK